ncbi:MAG: prealbumin-like fold domain-containing protein [Oscillospiraceae bacterium]|jgi:hypothetical protein|nr:prealbumin-like fold domain-containing protein [Oscillospiraceae bacterium]
MCNTGTCSYYVNDVACVSELPQPGVQPIQLCIRFRACTEDGCPVKGAVYQLTDSEGKYANAISGADGRVSFCGKIVPGTFVLTELAPPFGYSTDAEEHEVTVSACGCVMIDGTPARKFKSTNEKKPDPEQAQSDPPAVDAVAPGASTVTGTGVAGCYVQVTWPDDSKTCAAVLRDGSWALNVPDALELAVDDTVSAVQNCCGKKVSAAAEITVA